MSGTIELLLGGARSGKSDWAVTRAEKLGGAVVFVATAEAADEEMRARIEAHRSSRSPHWDTLEEPRDVAGRIRSLQREYDVAIVDCLTLLVSNWLLGGELDSGAGPGAEVSARIADLCAALRARCRHAIVVSNEIGSGIVPSNAVARRFRDELGAANRTAAGEADEVHLLVAGLPMSLKERSSRCRD